MQRFVLGLIIGLIVLPLFGWFYFRFGYAPVATASSPMPFEKELAHMALNARISKEAPKNAPIQPTNENFMAGARAYRAHCAVCHGLPDQLASSISKGMFPKPPQLFKGHGVTDDPAGETYWKVANGIRLTGMPDYRNSLNDTEMWQVSLMLARADKLPQDVREFLQRPLDIR
ncbi:MAG TPA: cytochrome c [Bryobacteraceae bacterium]|jgi:mono/diheme cytochrome c family protein|nr:cytochrome c [Bryobacteraceae bacterium]